MTQPLYPALELTDVQQRKRAIYAQLMLCVLGLIFFCIRNWPSPPVSLNAALVLGQLVTAGFLVGLSIRLRCIRTIFIAAAFFSTLAAYNLASIVPIASDERLLHAAAAFSGRTLFAMWLLAYTLLPANGLSGPTRRYLPIGAGVVICAICIPIALMYVLPVLFSLSAIPPLEVLSIATTVAAFSVFSFRASPTLTNVALQASLQCSAMDGILVMASPAHSLGVFAAKVLGLIACTSVPIVLLFESDGMYARIARQAQSYRTAAFNDPLTGIGNRRAYESYAEIAFDQLERRGASVGIVVIDVDNFKEYNDAFGHAAGDACLRRIAAAINSSLTGTGDRLFRFGGEEFVAVLCSKQPYSPRIVAERLREAVWFLAIPHRSVPHRRVTVSIGIAVSSEPGATKDVLFDLADEALYLAKRDGKNRTAVRWVS